MSINRVRYPPHRYEDEVFASKEFQKMMFGHLSNAEVDELLLKDECYLEDKDRVYERWDEVSDCSDDDEDYIDDESD